MLLQESNPYIRAAGIQAAILERTGLRKAYDYRLFYVLENSGSITIEDTSFDVCPDTIIVIPPATAYDFRGKLTVCVLNFDASRDFAHLATPRFPPRMEAFDPEQLFDTQLLEGFEQPRLIQGDVHTREEILSLVRQFNMRGEYSDATSSAMLKLFFSELLARNRSAEELLAEKVISYVRIHTADVTNNGHLAQIFGYHPVYLNSVIKQATGKTLHALIVDTKLQLACQWLVGTDQKINDIAHLAGFCSRTHFCTVFKKGLGVSPAEYRKNH